MASLLHLALFVLLLPLLLLLRFVLRGLVLRTQLQIGGLGRVPSPPLSTLQSWTTGHNVIKLLLGTECSETAHHINTFRHKLGNIFVLRLLFGVPSLVVTSPDAIRYITISKPLQFIKPAIMRNTLVGLTGASGILLAEGAQHTRLRRAVAPALHHDALMDVQRSFFREGRILSAELLAADSIVDSDNLLRVVRNAAFAVIFRTCFGDDAMSDDAISQLQHSYLMATQEPPAFSVRRALLQGVFDFLPVEWFGYQRHLCKCIRETVRNLCQESGKRKSETKLLQLMVDQETNKLIQNEQMVDTFLSFLTAGQVTTSISVCWTLYCLGRHPEWQDRLQAELSSWKEADGLEALDGLPLLQRIVKESLRLHPPATFTSRQTVSEAVIEGYKIPAGTQVRIPIMAVQTNEEVWGSDAKCFNPDRFLDRELVERTKFLWCVFLFGPRNCIGQRFAMLEIKSFIALIVQRCRVAVVSDGIPKCYGAFATPIGLEMRFEHRGDFSRN